MPRRALLILALLVIAVSVAWLVWPVSPSESKQRRTDGVESAADSHGAGPTAPGVAETVNREQMAAASSEDVDAVPEFAPHSTASNALTVEVFDITTGQPAAGAELFYLDRGHWDSELRNTVYAEEKSTTGQAIRYGIRYRCDENGTARISPRTGSAAIAARLPGLRGAIERGPWCLAAGRKPEKRLKGCKYRRPSHVAPSQRCSHRRS